MLDFSRLAVAHRVRFVPLFLGAGLLAGCQASSGAPNEDQGRDVPLVREAVAFEAVVPPNATLEGLLRQQLPDELARSVVEAARGVFNPRDLRAHRPYTIIHGLDGLFREFRYDIDADNFLRVVFRARPDASVPTFDAEVVPVPKELELDAVAVEITAEQDSLIGAFDAAGENLQLPIRLAEVFGGEVDFNSEIQRGDVTEVLFERATRDGEFVGYGDIKAAVLNVSGRRLTAIRYDGPDGKPTFYDEQGRSLRRQFLKSPLPFAPRVTSGFSSNRFHPVHGTRRPHLGVDYGAPSGTRVNAVAAGVVVSAEWAGDAGRMVRIRHTGGYETAYLHLSAFGPGIRPGVRVAQGDQVGRVGQTGAATGPHLDYRIIKNGVYVNPTAELAKMPPGDPIAVDRLEDFQRRRDEVLRELTVRLETPPDEPVLAVAR
jgi:murein DD-endopeptidase MepM/ murein hydrolase activator NlpD